MEECRTDISSANRSGRTCLNRLIIKISCEANPCCAVGAGFDYVGLNGIIYAD